MIVNRVRSVSQRVLAPMIGPRDPANLCVVAAVRAAFLRDWPSLGRHRHGAHVPATRMSERIIGAVSQAGKISHGEGTGL